MKEEKINILDLDVYSTKLSNGLEVYIIPDNKVNNTYCTYNTRYGSINTSFLYDNEYYTSPYGIAHFLEHKMFEEESGIDAFDFFSKRGSDANANTNFKKTTYLFSGPNSFYENLEFLLSYVESPYFTDENVSKEKGIIIEELEMYEDNPYSRIINTLLYNSFINDPMKYPVIGTRESINSITKEDLYKCYNTFYHPSNMYLVITGNVDKDKTINLIKEHEEKRNINNKHEIILKEYHEKDNVFKEYEEIKMDVTIPKFGIAYKINVEGYTEEEKMKLYTIITNAIDLKISSTSLFYEKLRNDNLISDTIEVGGVVSKNHIIVNILAEAKEVEKIIELIEKELKDLSITKEDFERRKKASISNLIYMTNNIFKINNRITNEILIKKKIDYDPIITIRNFKYEEIKKYLDKVNLNNKTICIIKPIK